MCPGAMPGGNDRTAGPAGRALFYGETRRRVVVAFDAGLRKLTEDTALSFAALVAEGRTPPPVWRAERCRACSLLELCRPKAMTKSALGFRNRLIAAALGNSETTG